MEIVVDRLVEELDILAAKDYDEGGFRDEIELAQTVWWGDPLIVAEQQYPLLYVQPVSTTDARGTTSEVWRDLTIQIVLLADPRTLYDEAEIVEATASRELVRASSAIERHLETINLAMPGGLGEDSRSVVVRETTFPPQLRGSLMLSSAVLTVVVQKAYKRNKQ